MKVRIGYIFISWTLAIFVMQPKISESFMHSSVTKMLSGSSSINVKLLNSSLLKLLKAQSIMAKALGLKEQAELAKITAKGLESGDLGSEEGMEKGVEMNRKYSEIWPVITEKKIPPKDAKNWENKENKFELYFDEKPGK